MLAKGLALKACSQASSEEAPVDIMNLMLATARSSQEIQDLDMLDHCNSQEAQGFTIS